MTSKLDWLDKNKIVRRAALLWVASLITYATIALFSDVAAITSAATTAFGLLTALLSPIFGKYFYDRAKDDNVKEE